MKNEALVCESSNHFELSIKGKYSIQHEHVRFTIVSDQPIRLASLTFLEIKNNNVYLVADGMIELSVASDGYKEEFKELDIDKGSHMSIFIIPVFSIIEASLVVSQKNFGDEGMKFAGLTKMLEKHNPSAFNSIRFDTIAEDSSIDKIPNIHRIVGEGGDNFIFNSLDLKSIQKTLTYLDLEIRNIEIKSFLNTFKDCKQLKHFRCILSLKADYSQEYSKETKFDKDFLGFLSKFSNLEIIYVILHGYSCSKKSEEIAEQISQMLMLNPRIVSIYYNSMVLMKKSGGRGVELKSPYWYQHSELLI
jgi:hypothetical protein